MLEAPDPLDAYHKRAIKAITVGWAVARLDPSNSPCCDIHLSSPSPETTHASRSQFVIAFPAIGHPIRHFPGGRSAIITDH